ncbi:MAG: MlaD family protein [Candidatus Sericytochromatia bacterium]|nr:MlaD family protein [Candidatus Sericytochromatia bacterium]
MISPAAKVGAATLASLIAIGVGLSWLTSFSLRPTGYDFTVRFGDVAGLLPGANVRYMGLRIGRVKHLDPRGALVEVTVHVNDSETQLPKNGRYKIMSLGIIGEKALEIFPPKPPLQMKGQPAPSPVPIVWLKPQEAVRGEDPSRLELVLDEVTDTFESFRKSVDPKKFERLFAKTAENLANTTETVNRLGNQAEGILKGLEATPRDISQLLKTVNQLATHANELAAATTPQEVAGIIGDMRTLSRGLVRNYEVLLGPQQTAANQRAVQDLRSLIHRLDQLATTLNSTAGDPEIQRDLKDTVRNIRDLTARVTGATALTESKNFDGIAIEPQVQAVGLNKPDGTGLAANLGVRMRVANNTIAAGIEQVGEGNFFNLSLGDTKVWGPAGYHFGLIRSKIGVGLDYGLTDRVTLMGQLFDPFRPHIRLGASYFPLGESQYGLMAQWARPISNNENTVWLGLEWRPVKEAEKK